MLIGMSHEQLNATVVGRIELTKELVILHIEPDKGVPDFIPGQYVALALPASALRPSHFPPEREPHSGDKLVKRAYSIGSAPTQKKHIEFYVAIVPDGTLTSRLVLLQPGDRVFVAPKITGTFTIEGLGPEANLIFVSTGTGIAPYMSMLRTPATWCQGRKITMLHGVRHATDLAYREELEHYSRENTDFRYIPVVSRDAQWSGERGHVQKQFIEGRVSLDPSCDHVFLCGNPAMIDELEKLLAERGYREHTRRAPGNLHLERYW